MDRRYAIDRQARRRRAAAAAVFSERRGRRAALWGLRRVVVGLREVRRLAAEHLRKMVLTEVSRGERGERERGNRGRER
jgi:hypothetical protein